MIVGKHLITALLVVFLTASAACSKSGQNTAGRQDTAAGSQSTEGRTDVVQSDSERNTPRGDTQEVSDGSSPGTRRLMSIDDRVLQANTEFGFDLLKEMLESDKGTNIFCSPLSVSFALAMTLNGARGETESAIAKVLGFEDIDMPVINQAFADLITNLAAGDSAVQVNLANSLWGREGFAFEEDFLKINDRFYHAKTTSLDFGDPAAPGVINSWVKEETRGKIEGIVEKIPPETVLYLINAIYFKGVWEREFDPDKTQDAKFTLADGNQHLVPMMNQSGKFRYLENDDLQAVRLPYGSGRLAMYVFLPRDSDGLEKLIGGLEKARWDEWMSKLRPKNGDVSLPRFKMKYHKSLKELLDDLGMGIAFDRNADLSGISKNVRLAITEVKHKAVVDVSEEGTEAAAVTSVEIGVTAVRPDTPFHFVADHPFFFTIRDDATGSILFLGTLNDPVD